MSTVVEINDIDSLADYRLAWNALLPGTPGASFFHSLGWFETYWRHFGGGQRLRTLIVQSGGRVIGILPLVVRRHRTRVGAARVLTYPLHDWGAFYGPVGPDVTATLLAGLRHVRRTACDWDVVELPWVNRDEHDRHRTPRTMEQAGLTAVEAAGDLVARIDLATGWDDYWQSRSSHRRTNVRRSEKKLAARGRLEFVRYRPLGAAHLDDDPRWDLFEACVGISRKSWQGSSTSGTTMSHASVRDFLRDAHAAAARAGCLDLNLLLLDGRPLAFAYNYHYDGHVFGLRMGYDAALSRDGAGTVLLLKTVKDSFRRGDRVYDLGPAYLSGKRHWWTQLARSYRYTHYPRTAPRAQMLRLGRWVKGWLKPQAADFGQKSRAAAG